MRALLDINVLLALLDADHVDHRRAQEWISGEIQHGWASCALTQNGFVRILSQPRYPSPVSPSEAVERLRRATSTEYHEYWPCSISFLEDRRINSSHVHGSRQVTDVYLLALAVEQGGRFVTFDRSIPLSAVPGATPEHLIVV
ncbi:MAG TPA: type II toxin-antitoxin system VapC family toxin [Thermoanaerobaculia bacterium]|nr:type II toxin-antitoxin system VapC family toxin [Thermoanaerobaculia bacterium]